jgi:hypothetical protein
MSNKSIECWTTDPQAKAIRVEPAGGHTFILPYIHFVYAELTANGSEQTLKIVFSTHEVVLRGRGLRRLEGAVHRMELASVMPLADCFRAAVPQGQPFISEVTVIAADDAKSNEVSASGEET